MPQKWQYFVELAGRHEKAHHLKLTQEMIQGEEESAFALFLPSQQSPPGASHFPACSAR
jgi:hypothetical protein